MLTHGRQFLGSLIKARLILTVAKKIFKVSFRNRMSRAFLKESLMAKEVGAIPTLITTEN